MAGTTNIRITPSDMRDRAKEYEEQAEIVGDVIEKMDGLLERLQSEWEGQASIAYAEKFGELRPGFVKAQELIMDISKALNQTAANMEDADNQIASAFRG